MSEMATGLGAAGDGVEVGGGGLSELEVEVIDLFVSGVRLLGVPKSIGEIYGYLYITERPVSLDGLVGMLRMSKGSASQGLRFLRKVGAVKLVYVAGERRDYYEAVTELKQLVAGFIREELAPHLRDGEVRLARLGDLVAAVPEGGEGEGAVGGRAFYERRVKKLAQWRRRSMQLLPFVERVLGR